MTPRMKQIPLSHIQDAIEVMAKAKWHCENPDASSKIPSHWDNSALHIQNLLHISIQRLGAAYPTTPIAER